MVHVLWRVCWTLVLLSIVAGVMHVELQMGNEVDITVNQDECMAILLPDGFSHNCPNRPTKYTLPRSRYRKLGIVLYDRTTRRIKDALKVTSTEHSPSEDVKELSLLIPKNGDVLTSGVVEFNFFYQPNHRTLDSIDDEPRICIVAFRWPSLVISGLAEEWINCSSTPADHTLSLHAIPSGSYLAQVFAVWGPRMWSSATFSASFSTFRASNQMTAVRGDAMASVTFHQVQVMALDHTQDVIMPLRGSNDEAQFSGLSLPAILDSGNVKSLSVESLQDAVHVLAMSTRSKDRYSEAEVMLKSLLYSRRHLRGGGGGGGSGGCALLVLHLVLDDGGLTHFLDLWHRESSLRASKTVVIVLHGFTRVCADPVKQFLSSTGMRPSFHHSGPAGYCRLTIPPYFTDLGDQIAELESSTASSTGISSAHGLQSVQLRALLSPNKLITLETDQLVLTDIAELWAKFEDFDENDVLAAAENYQPWMHSRPFTAPSPQQTTRGSDDLDSMVHAQHHHGDYHGYGIIGGVMMLHLSRMRDLRWSSTLSSALRSFQQRASEHSTAAENITSADSSTATSASFSASASASSSSSSSASVWEAKLNDQDVFNAVLSESPQYVMILPCEWNVQIHARLNVCIHCLDHLLTLTPHRVDSSPVYQYNEQSQSQGQTSSQFFRENFRSMSDIPVSCEASIQAQVFSCPSRAKVLHFMAQAYMGDYHFMEYYSLSWEYHQRLPWSIVAAE